MMKDETLASLTKPSPSLSLRYFGYPGRQHRMSEIQFMDYRRIVLWKTTLMVVNIEENSKNKKQKRTFFDPPQPLASLLVQIDIDDPSDRLRVLPQSSASFQGLSLESLMSHEVGSRTFSSTTCTKDSSLKSLSFPVIPGRTVPFVLAVSYLKGFARVEGVLSVRLVSLDPSTGEKQFLQEAKVHFLIQNRHYAQRSSRLSQPAVSTTPPLPVTKHISGYATRPRPPVSDGEALRTKAKEKVEKEEKTKNEKVDLYLSPRPAPAPSSSWPQTILSLSSDSVSNSLSIHAATDGQRDNSTSSSSSSSSFSSPSSFSETDPELASEEVDEKFLGEWEDLLGWIGVSNSNNFQEPSSSSSSTTFSSSTSFSSSSSSFSNVETGFGLGVEVGSLLYFSTPNPFLSPSPSTC